MEYSAKTRLPLHSIGIIYPSPSLHITLIWYNLSLIFTCTNGRESKKGSQKTSFLAIHAKGGEILSPKQKDRTTTNFEILQIKLLIGIPLEIISQLVSIFQIDISQNPLES
jgi:hypothetical protein